MYCDLNIPFDSKLDATLAMAELLGYDVVAVSIEAASAKEVKNCGLTPAVFENLQNKFPKLRLLKRLTIVLSEHINVAQLTQAAPLPFDVVAAVPKTEKQLQSAATQLDIDLIVVETNGRLPYPLRHKLVGAAISRGVRFEINYSGIATGQTKHLIANASTLFRVSRDKGVVLSSGAMNPQTLRAPLDVANLVNLWGLKNAKESVTKQPIAAATQGTLRARSAKQAILEVEEPPAKKQRTS